MSMMELRRKGVHLRDILDECIEQLRHSIRGNELKARRYVAPWSSYIAPLTLSSTALSA